MRRLSEDTLRSLQQALDAGTFDLDRQLHAHLAFLTEEALRKRGRPRVLEGESAEGVVDEWYAAGGEPTLKEMIRVSSEPGEFARRMRMIFSNWLTDLRRREGQPRLYDKTSDVLEQDDGTNFKCFKKMKAKRLSQWGRPPWSRPPDLHPHESESLLREAKKIIAGMKRVRDRPDKPSAPMILRKHQISALVGSLLDRFSQLLQLEHFGWLYPRLFPADYGRGGPFVPLDDVVLGEDDPGYDAAMDRATLEAFDDRESFERVAAVVRHDGDVESAADEANTDPRILQAFYDYALEELRQVGGDEADLKRIIRRIFGAGDA
jgi:hypothetical protein